MPSYEYEMTVHAPLEKVWEFVRCFDNWAPYVPGYIEHEMLNERESIWKFKSKIGIVKKKLEFKVEIGQWIEFEKVTFQLNGINEKMSGHGFFKAMKETEQQTKMIGFIDVTAEGTLAKIMNPLLKSSIPEFTEELTIAVGQKIAGKI